MTEEVIEEIVNEPEVAPVIESQDSVEGGEAKPEDAKKEKAPWYNGRIAELSADKRELKAEIQRERIEKELIKAQLEAVKADKGLPVTDENLIPKAEAMKMVKEEAARIATQKAFDDRCNAIVSTGERQYRDFNESLSNLGMIGAVGENANPSFLQALTELPQAHAVLHHLGNNLNDAKDILNLPPLKMAIELAKIETALAKPKAISEAPVPVKPINGKARGETDILDPELSMKDYHAMREKQRLKNV